MNLLVTNTRNAQAYGIIRSLRPQANKIVATMYGPTRFVARLSHAVNSRYVDKRYFVPSAVEDWRAGLIQKENTEREENYIQAILRICDEESIDTIFPSWEPKVYIFAKNKERFTERNILLPIPDYDALICAMDKYETVQKAVEVGFPSPKTVLLRTQDQLEEVERWLQYPMITKPRSSSGSRGVAVVRDRRELLSRISFKDGVQDKILVQEFIPGSQLKRFTSIWVVLDKTDRLIGCSLHTKLRTVFRDSSSQGTAWASFRDDKLIDAAVRLCRALRVSGPINIQTKLDPRDGVHKLIEVNPRIGYNYWIPQKMGLDIPLLAVKIAQGGVLRRVEQQRERMVFISPVGDTVAFGVTLIELLASRIPGWHAFDPEDASLRLSSMLKSYRDSYRAPNRLFDPFFRDFFQDPLVSLSWWAAFGVFSLRSKLRAMPGIRRVPKQNG